MLCRRVRFLYSLNEDAAGLKLHVRLARVIHRLAYSHGHTPAQGRPYIEISHEELSKMLGASRQSVSKELKSLEREGDIELRYNKIHICDLERLADKYEKAVGMEQITASYDKDK
jgi:CRP-like cAMP-binding protein